MVLIICIYPSLKSIFNLKYFRLFQCKRTLMKYFLLKKPTNLFLIPEPYSANVPVPSVLQVRYKGNQSNSKLVKCRNGQWYIKNGSYMIELKSVPSNPMKIVSMNEEGGTFVDEVNSKWFLHNKK